MSLIGIEAEAAWDAIAYQHLRSAAGLLRVGCRHESRIDLRRQWRESGMRPPLDCMCGCDVFAPAALALKNFR